MPLTVRLRENPLVRQVVGFIDATPHHPGVLSGTAHEIQAPLATTARLDVALCPLRQQIRPLTRGMDGRAGRLDLQAHGRALRVDHALRETMPAFDKRTATALENDGGPPQSARLSRTR